MRKFELHQNFHNVFVSFTIINQRKIFAYKKHGQKKIRTLYLKKSLLFQNEWKTRYKTSEYKQQKFLNLKLCYF